MGLFGKLGKLAFGLGGGGAARTPAISKLAFGGVGAAAPRIGGVGLRGFGAGVFGGAGGIAGRRSGWINPRNPFPPKPTPPPVPPGGPGVTPIGPPVPVPPGGGNGDPLWDGFYDPKNPEGNLGGLTSAAMLEMIKGGAFNLGGSQSYVDALRGQAVGDADALRARSNTIGAISGMDPAQAASSYFQRDMGSQGEVQRILLNARLQSMNQNRASLENLANTGAAAKWQNWLDEMAKQRAKTLGFAP